MLDKSKIGVAVAEAFDVILKEIHFAWLQTDMDKEFYNALVVETLKHRGTHYFSSENEMMKASLVELYYIML